MAVKEAGCAKAVTGSLVTTCQHEQGTVLTSYSARLQTASHFIPSEVVLFCGFVFKCLVF